VVLIERTENASAAIGLLPWPVLAVPMGLPFGATWSSSRKLAVT